MSDREIMNAKGMSQTVMMTFRDPVVKRVCEKFRQRSDVGYEKYGRTLHEERTTRMKGLLGYLNDIQEELMDAVLYIQAAREEIQDDLEAHREWNEEYED